jgi:excisionase family DNA binding protein
MTDGDYHSQRRIFLLESEAAERLRCSTRTVRRLRASGKLAYLPGRPTLIDESDLNAYVDSIRIAATSVADAKNNKNSPDKVVNKVPDVRAETALRKLRMRVALRRLTSGAS